MSLQISRSENKISPEFKIVCSLNIYFRHNPEGQPGKGDKGTPNQLI